MNYTRTQHQYWKTYAFTATILILLTTVILYVTLVFKTVSYTGARQRAEVSINDVTEDISQSESQYLALENNITESTAEKMGFESVAVEAYVSKSSPVSLSYSAGH